MTEARLLGIYLSDHLAGSIAGLELAKRCLSNNRGSELGQFLEHRLVPEISGDQEALKDVMWRLGVKPSAPKNALGWTGEKIGRLKFNGTLKAYSPLSRLVELEGLTIGITGKLGLWQALRATHSDDPRLRGVDLDTLLGRARAQLEALEEHRLAAARQAFHSQTLL